MHLCTLCHTPLPVDGPACTTCGTSATAGGDVPAVTSPPRTRRDAWSHPPVAAAGTVPPPSSTIAGGTAPPAPSAVSPRRLPAGTVELRGVVTGPASLDSATAPVGRVVLLALPLVVLVALDVRSTGGRSVPVVAALLLTPVPALAVLALRRAMLGRRLRSPSDGRLDVLSFRLVDDDGHHHDCQVLGGVRTGMVRHGDTLRLTGRRDRDRTLLVASLVNERTGATARVLPPLGYRAVQLAQVAVAVAVVAAALGLVGVGA